MARFRPIDDSPNARAPGPDWGNAVVDAYGDAARLGADSAWKKSESIQRSFAQLGGVAEDVRDVEMQRMAQAQEMAARQQMADEQLKRQKELEDTRIRQEIWADKEKYNYKAQQELARYRNALTEVDTMPWTENVKAQVRGQINTQMMGVKSNEINFAPQPPSAQEQWDTDHVVDKDNGFVSFRQPDGKWEVKPLPKPAAPPKTTPPKQIDYLKALQQATTELSDPETGEAPTDKAAVDRRTLEIIEDSQNIEALRDRVFATSQPTSQPSGGVSLDAWKKGTMNTGAPVAPAIDFAALSAKLDRGELLTPEEEAALKALNGIK